MQKDDDTDMQKHGNTDGRIDRMKLAHIPLTSPSKLILRAIIVLHGNRCRYCGGKADGTDHVVPKSKGGSDSVLNIVAVCRSCNSSKGANRLPSDLEREVLSDAVILAPAVRELAASIGSAEAEAQERRRNIRPWMVA